MTLAGARHHLPKNPHAPDSVWRRERDRDLEGKRWLGRGPQGVLAEARGRVGVEGRGISLTQRRREGLGGGPEQGRAQSSGSAQSTGTSAPSWQVGQGGGSSMLETPPPRAAASLTSSHVPTWLKLPPG